MSEDRRDCETAEVDHWTSVVVGMGQWWSEVGAGVWVEQGREMWHVWPYLTPALTALYLSNQNPSHKKGCMRLYGPPRLICNTGRKSYLRNHTEYAKYTHYVRSTIPLAVFAR